MRYSARCSACGNEFSINDDHAYLRRDDGTLVSLEEHGQGQADALKEAGFTWKRAYDEARVVRGRCYLCKQCGGVHEERDYEGPLGCLAGSLIFLALLPFQCGLWAYLGYLQKMRVARGGRLLRDCAPYGRMLIHAALG